MTSLRIISRYARYKKAEYLYIGIVALLLTEPWWSTAISFLLIIITGTGLSVELYVIIGNVGIPVAITLWIKVYSELKTLDDVMVKRMFYFSTLYNIIFMLFFFYFLTSDITVIGELTSPIDVRYNVIMILYLFITVILIYMTTISFAKELLKSDSREMKLRGKLIICGFTFFTIGAFLDFAIPLTPITLLMARSLLVACAFQLWGGFIMPDWMKRVLLPNRDDLASRSDAH